METSLVIFLLITAAKYDFQALHLLLGNYTPRLEPCLPDGFFLDFTGERRVKEYLSAMCQQLEELLGRQFCLGLGPNKLTARQLAEAGGPDRLKPRVTTATPYLSYYLPNRQTPLWYLKAGQLKSFVATRPVNSLWPCPPEIIAKLNRLGIQNNNQLAQIPDEQLEHHFGYWGSLLHQYSRGQDPSPVRSLKAEQELSYSRMLTHSATSLQVIDAILAEGARVIADKLAEQQAGFLELVCYFYLKNEVVELKRRFTQPQSSRTVIRDNAMLLIKHQLNISHSLYGLKLSARAIAPQLNRQLTLFEHPQSLKSPEADGHYRLEQEIASLHKRFNRQVLRLGRDLSISRREQMLQLVDPFRKEYNHNGGIADGQVCPQSAKGIL